MISACVAVPLQCIIGWNFSCSIEAGENKTFWVYTKRPLVAKAGLQVNEPCIVSSKCINVTSRMKDVSLRCIWKLSVSEQTIAARRLSIFAKFRSRSICVRQSRLRYAECGLCWTTGSSNVWTLMPPVKRKNSTTIFNLLFILITDNCLFKNLCLEFDTFRKK